MMNLNWLETFSDSVRLNFDQSFHKDLFVFRIYLPINEIFIIEQDQVLAYGASAIEVDRLEHELAQVGNKNFFNKISQKMVCRLKKFKACATEKKGGKPTNVSTCMRHAGK